MGAWVGTWVEVGAFVAVGLGVGVWVDVAVGSADVGVPVGTMTWVV